MLRAAVVGGNRRTLSTRGFRWCAAFMRACSSARPMLLRNAHAHARNRHALACTGPCTDAREEQAERYDARDALRGALRLLAAHGGEPKPSPRALRVLTLEVSHFLHVAAGSVGLVRAICVVHALVRGCMAEVADVAAIGAAISLRRRAVVAASTIGVRCAVAGHAVIGPRAAGFTTGARALAAAIERALCI